MKSKTKIYTYVMLALFFMIMSIFYADNSKNTVSVQTSGSLELSNTKIEW